MKGGRQPEIGEKDMQFIIDHIDTILAGFGGLVVLATAITKLTPTTWDDALLAKLLRIFSLAKGR